MDSDEDIEVFEISIKGIQSLFEKEEIIDSASIAIFSKALKFLN